MYYALIHYLENYPVELDEFRRKYDKRFEVLAPHLTFVFPVDEQIGEEALVSHIQEVLSEFEPFPFSLDGIIQSWDNLVFWMVEDGLPEVHQLHDRLYTKILAPFLRSDIQYEPHVTIGQLHKENLEPLQEAQTLGLNFTAELQKLTLIKHETETSPVIWKKEFAINRK